MGIRVTPETIGAALGAGVASAAIVITSAKRWLTKSSEDKLNAVAGELGVCESGVPSGAPTLSSLVMSTATAVQRLEDHAEKNSNGISRLLEVQEVQGNQLSLHGHRLDAVETKTEAVASHVEAVRANLEAMKANRVAVHAQEEALHDRQEMLKQIAVANAGVLKLLKTNGNVKKGKGSR